MAKSVTSARPTGTEPEAPPKRRRLPAAARKSSILAAARRAFTETGDMNGTTIKLIAERSGISEGVIYRHFESKDQLFFEAVVEPLTKAVDDLVEAWREVEDRYGHPFESPDISARAIMGMALIMALEGHHGKKFDRNRALTLMSEGTVKGFFPAIKPARRRR